VEGYLYIALAAVIGAAIVSATLVAARLLRPDRPYAQKLTVYESGEPTIGTTEVQFNVNYYLFGIMFVLFEVEVAFLYPWALAFQEAALPGLVAVIVFIVVLLEALWYAWKRGALEWVY